jgi:hypothetical protein
LNGEGVRPWEVVLIAATVTAWLIAASTPGWRWWQTALLTMVSFMVGYALGGGRWPFR